MQTARNIVCPNCKHEFPVEEALASHLRTELENEFKQKLKTKEADLVKQIEEKQNKDLAILKEELNFKSKKLAEAEELEIQIRRDKLKLEEEKRSFEVEKQRELDAEREKIRARVETELVENQRLKDREKDKVISDLKNALEDAQRKATQGSQQLQGEVAELDLEESLAAKFPFDIIEPVKKGARGADVMQTVKTQMGNNCGTILWESKRTQAWSDGWVGKLKEDLRQVKANIPVIVANNLPDGAKNGYGLVDGVHVCSPTLAIPIAEILRQKLIDVAREKFISQNQSTKAEGLYQYIVSHEFSQQIEAIVEVYQQMQEQITKERAAYERIWKTRETQVNRLLKSTANVVGSIRGVGATLPSLKGVDTPELEA